MNEDMEETQSPNPWPTGDATPERFNLMIDEDRSVMLFDGRAPLETFTGSDALADALQRRMQLKELEAAELEEMTPAEFLTETLPKVARQQRLEGVLAEVRTAEASALAGLTDAITLLNRAVSLRERLEKALEATVRPLSATESAERAPGVGRVTPGFNRLRGEAAKLHLLPRIEDSNPSGFQPHWSRSWTESETVSRIGTYKPQPY